MTKVQVGVLGAVVLLGLVASMVIQHNAQAAFQAQDQALRQQSADLTRQQAENARLTDLAQAAGSRRNSPDDLARVRREVESLRSQTNRLAETRKENRRLRTLGAQQEYKRDLALVIYTMQWGEAFRRFASQNGGRFPTTFDQARPFLRDGARAATNFPSADFEVFYGGTLASITNGTPVVVLRERQPHFDPGPGTWVRFYGFADGRPDVAWVKDGNFEPWEKQHVFLPPPDK